MIQSSPFTANFSLLSLNESPKSVLDDIASHPYNSDNGFGFKIVRDGGSTVSGYLVEKSVVNQRTFDEEIDEVKNIEITRKDPIPFYLNATDEFLEVYSNQGDTRKVTTRIGEVTDWAVSVRDIPLELSELYDYFRARKSVREVSSLRITNFEAEDSISGTYTIKQADSNTIEEMIDGSKGQISVLRLGLILEGNHVKVGFYRSGSVQLYTSVEEDEDVWSAVRQAITEVHKP